MQIIFFWKSFPLTPLPHTDSGGLCMTLVFSLAPGPSLAPAPELSKSKRGPCLALTYLWQYIQSPKIEVVSYEYNNSIEIHTTEGNALSWRQIYYTMNRFASFGDNFGNFAEITGCSLLGFLNILIIHTFKIAIQKICCKKHLS